MCDEGICHTERFTITILFEKVFDAYSTFFQTCIVYPRGDIMVPGKQISGARHDTKPMC
jgi:hypothetical protein